MHYTSAGNLAIDEDLLERHLDYENWKKIGELTKEIMEQHPGEMPEKFDYKGNNAYGSRGRIIHALEDMAVKGRVLIEGHPTKVKLAGTQEEQIHSVEHEGLARDVENRIRKLRDVGRNIDFSWDERMSIEQLPGLSKEEKSNTIGRMEKEVVLKKRKAFIEAYYKVMDDAMIAPAVKEAIVEEFKDDEDLK